MNLTLESLLSTLEKQAADQEDSEDMKEKAKEEGKAEGEAEAKEDAAADKLKSAERDLEDAKKKEEQVKEAQLQGAALAQEIMQKVASANIATTKETQMNKQASAAGQALAAALLEKLAQDMTTDNGIVDGAVPNRMQTMLAEQVAEHDAIIRPTPTKDAAGNGGGSINQIFDAIVADAMAGGAASMDQVHTTGISAVEGAPEDHPVNVQAVQAAPVGAEAADEVEKVAAVNALMGEGIDLFSAVELVKAAEEEIMFEEAQQVKQAAMNELLAAGVDFAMAAEMVKSASAGQLLLGASTKAKAMGHLVNAKDSAMAAARALPGQAKEFGNTVLGRTAAKARGDHLRTQMGIAAAQGNLVGARLLGLQAQAVYGRDAQAVGRARLKAGIGAAGLAGTAGAGGYALTREKQAAVNGLVEAGVDFDSAVDLVSAKSYEMFGA